LVFAVREPCDEHELAGLSEQVVAGLGDRDARALLDSAVAGRLDERVRDRIVAEARGNPLALLELPRGLTPAELAGGFALPDASPLASKIEQSFLRQLVGGLPGRRGKHLQEVHRALADVTDPNLDPDRRAWHRAHAAVGADDEVASELERSAGRAQARGGLAAAAAFLERAAMLTVEPAHRAPPASRAI